MIHSSKQIFEKVGIALELISYLVRGYFSRYSLYLITYYFQSPIVTLGIRSNDLEDTGSHMKPFLLRALLPSLGH